MKTPQQISPSAPIKATPLTYTVQIGNTDNRLTHQEWIDFIDGLGHILAELELDIHFFGYSNPTAPWQNCCAVFNVPATREANEAVRALLAKLASEFSQDSIALTVGSTTFVKGAS